jgi:hypothetical protein
MERELATNASQNSLRYNSSNFHILGFFDILFSIKTQYILALLQNTHTYADYKFSQLSAPISMAFHKHIFTVALILALSLSSTDVSQATRHLLDTPAIPTTNLALSVIPSDLPMLRAQHPFLVQPKTTFSPFHPLSEVSTQPTLTNCSFPILSSTETPSQPKLPKTTMPQLPTNHLPLLPGTQMAKYLLLPHCHSCLPPRYPQCLLNQLCPTPHCNYIKPNFWHIQL